MAEFTKRLEGVRTFSDAVKLGQELRQRIIRTVGGCDEEDYDFIMAQLVAKREELELCPMARRVAGRQTAGTTHSAPQSEIDKSEYCEPLSGWASTSAGFRGKDAKPLTAENLAKTLRTVETRGQRNKTKNGGYRKTATVAMTEQIQIMRERLLVLNERLEVQLMNLSEGTVIKGMEAVATTLNDMAAEGEESARIVADHYCENARQQKEAVGSRKNPKVTPFDQPDKRVDTPPEESKTKKSGSEEASPTERSIGRSETGGSGSDAGNGSNDCSDSGGWCKQRREGYL